MVMLVSYTNLYVKSFQLKLELYHLLEASEVFGNRRATGSKVRPKIPLLEGAELLTLL